METSWTWHVLGESCHGLFILSEKCRTGQGASGLALSVVLRYKIYAKPKHRIGKH